MVGVVGVDCDWSIFRALVSTGLLEPEDAAGGGELRRGIFGPGPLAAVLLVF